MGKFFLYNFITRQEFDTFIVFKHLRERSSSCIGTMVTEETHLHAALVHFRIWAGRRRKVDSVRRGENIVRVCSLRQIPALSLGDVNFCSILPESNTHSLSPRQRLVGGSKDK